MAVRAFLSSLFKGKLYDDTRELMMDTRPEKGYILTLDLKLLLLSCFRFGFLRFFLKDLDIWF